MIQIYGCITGQHDLRLVVLAGIICLFATYTALSLFARAQSSTDHTRYFWLAGTALVAGTGVWATHFVAMLAYDPGLPIGYDVSLTAASVIVAVLLSGLGFFVALHRHTASLGGGIFGVAVGEMHFIGMSAMRSATIQHWDVGYILVSVLFGIVFGGLALSIATRHNRLWARFAAAGLLVLGICGLHFTAMTALSLEPDPTAIVPDAMIDHEWLAVAIAAVMTLILGLSFAGTVVDQHLASRSAQEAERLRRHVAELEATKRELETKTKEVTLALEAAAAASQAKSQFLAAMSHELRTPLNAIIGFSEMLSREMFGALDARYRDYATNIYDSGRHLLGLINDVLDFSKLEAGRFELQDDSIEVDKVIAETINIIGQQAERNGLRLILNVAPQLPRIHADSRRVRQILLNLVSNSIKFTPEGGEIKISAAINDGELVLTIADTGIGMSADDIPKALMRFGQIDSRLSRKYDGTGLGLPLSKRLVELHGGTLEIESIVGTGTIVTVRFPSERVDQLKVA
jgi:signal transduction histidine kinase